MNTLSFWNTVVSASESSVHPIFLSVSICLYFLHLTPQSGTIPEALQIRGNGCFVWMYVCAPHVCNAQEARKGPKIPWTWSYRQLWATKRVTGTEFQEEQPLLLTEGTIPSAPNIFTFLDRVSCMPGWLETAEDDLSTSMIACDTTTSLCSPEVHT